MGYLNNASVTVDAILTKKGREILSMGSRDKFEITQFALSDDEVDYDLWNPAHPLGTNYYGAVIENLPLIEALPDENQMMKYKLVTLPKKAQKIPIIEAGTSTITLNGIGATQTITPKTVNLEGGNSTLGYTFILSNSDVADIRVSAGKAVSFQGSPTIPQFIGDQDSPRSISQVGFGIDVVAKPSQAYDKSATLTIIANETGGSKTISIIVKKLAIAQVTNLTGTVRPGRSSTGA